MATRITDRKTYQSEGGAIGPNKLVKVGTASSQVVVGTIDAAPFGVTVSDAAAAAKPISVELLSPNKIVPLTAAAAIADKALVLAASTGKVQTATSIASGTYYRIGYAEGAASGDGSELMVRICAAVGDTYVVS